MLEINLSFRCINKIFNTAFIRLKVHNCYSGFACAVILIKLIPLSANPQNVQTQIICGLFPTNCLNVLSHFVGLALKGLISLDKHKFKVYRKDTGRKFRNAASGEGYLGPL